MRGRITNLPAPKHECTAKSDTRAIVKYTCKCSEELQLQTHGGLQRYDFIYGGFLRLFKIGRNCLILLVGAGRFERPTPCAQGRCATRLRYAPTSMASLILNHFPNLTLMPT